MNNTERFKEAISENSEAVGFDIINATFGEVFINNVIIADCSFQSVNFNNYDFSRLYDNKFENCSAIECNSYKGEIYRNRFQNCHFSNCNFRKALISNLGKEGINKGSIEDSIFVNCDFTWSHFANVKLRSVTFQNCKINQELLLNNDCVDVKFIDCMHIE